MQVALCPVNRSVDRTVVKNNSIVPKPVLSVEKELNSFNSPVSSSYLFQLPNVRFSGAEETNYIKEVTEQPKVIANLVGKYFGENPQEVSNLNLNISEEGLKNIQKIAIVASGSSKNVAMMAKDFIENVAKIPVEVDFASEYAHRNPSVKENELAVFISQSGETADTLAALLDAKRKGAETIALTNVARSKIDVSANSSMDVGAGKEKAVAATKSVTAQLVNLYALGLKLAQSRGTLSTDKIEEYSKELNTISAKLSGMLQDTASIESLAKDLALKKDFYILGRGANYGAALEGALKLRETSYFNSTAFPSGEFLHGYIASVDKDTPVISIVQGNVGDENYELAYKNTKEVMDKRAPENLVIIKNESNKKIEEDPSFKNAVFLNIPDTKEAISPLYSVVRFQMLANYITKAQGNNPDNPRSLTKAVLSE